MTRASKREEARRAAERAALRECSIEQRMAALSTSFSVTEAAIQRLIDSVHPRQ